MFPTVHVLGIVGSLRRESYNRATLRTAQELAPEGMTIETFDIAPIPPYNYDVEVEGLPEPVKEMKARIQAADGLLIVTPEYNYSLPGVLKNAIDWASRPTGGQPLDRKPLAMMGASTGTRGTARAQHHLRQVAVMTNMLPFSKPEVLIDHAARRFDADLNLTDENFRRSIRQLLEEFAWWIERLRRPL